MAVRDPELAGWLLASLSSGLVAIDERGAVTALNEAAQRILGTPPGELDGWLGRDFREVLVERPQLVELLADARDGRERPSRAELALEPLPGRDAGTIGFTLLPVRDPEGAVRGAAIQFRDLAALERAGEQERLRDRLAALGEMAAGLAHELRNPLAGMEVVAGLLRRRVAAGGEEEELVRELLGQLRAMARTLESALEFVRPVPLAARELDLAALADEALDRALARVGFPGKVERRYASGLPPLRGDPDLLRSAVTDLVVNALEAMLGVESVESAECVQSGESTGPVEPSESWASCESSESWEDGREPRLEVELRAERRSGPQGAVRVGPEGLPAAEHPGPRLELVLSVGDTGPGVPPELRERIFYPFFTTKAGGTGVGLAAAQKVASAHGGHIEVSDRAGGGALFRLRLPLRSAES